MFNASPNKTLNMESTWSPSLSCTMSSTLGATFEPTACPGSPTSKETKERAYQMFREGPGEAVYANVRNAKARLKDTKTKAKVS